MTKKTRLVILLICIILFLIITPYIILYALGYRIDFAHRKITAIGGIYLRVLPQGVNISVDNISYKTGLFSNDVFVQNLLPVEHAVTIKKNGYYDYQKTLLVQEKEVTKLEDVILFKVDDTFSLLQNKVSYFSVAPNNNTLLVATLNNAKTNLSIINLETSEKRSVILPAVGSLNIIWSENSNKALASINNSYFLIDLSSITPLVTQPSALITAHDVHFNPENDQELFFIKSKNLYSTKQSLALVKNVATYKIAGSTITWLSYDGFVYEFDIANKTNTKITAMAFPVKNYTSYKLANASQILFLQADNSLFWLNPESTEKSFENFYTPITSLVISPNGQKIIYFNDNEIVTSILNEGPIEKLSLYKSNDKIQSVRWINDSYIIFTLEDGSIKISETDARGNVNTITLPATIVLDSQKTIDIKNPSVAFDQQNKKLYILTQGSLIVSERLVP